MRGDRLGTWERLHFSFLGLVHYMTRLICNTNLYPLRGKDGFKKIILHSISMNRSSTGTDPFVGLTTSELSVNSSVQSDGELGRDDDG